MDDGRLTDGQGRTVDFKNTVVIMTSNAGSGDLKRAARIGFLQPKGENEREEQHEAMRSKALEGLKRMFRPEFLNRIDQVVVFHALGKEELNQILELLLGQVRGRLSDQEITLEVSAEVRELLLREGFDEEYGARPLRRTIQTYVDDVLADAVLAGQLVPGQTAHLVLNEGKVALEAQTVSLPA
jgi:ATP-dependent Clp protease ATP-binding subunit ClpC